MMNKKKYLEFKLKYFFFFLFICFTALHCQNPTKNTIAFYHWKSEFDWSIEEQRKSEYFQVDKMYLRLWDWKWENNQLQKVARLTVYSEYTSSIEFIPIIYIDNMVFKTIHENDIDSLALETIKDIEAYFPFEKLQIDCDWTASTRKIYFDYLASLKKHKKALELSSTLRLHQIKDKELMGIPPVDYLTLMYYNMGDLYDVNTEESILNNEIGKAYLKNAADYPKDLEVALPMFSWAVVERYEAVVKLVRNCWSDDLEKPHLYKKIQNQKYLVLESHYLNGEYLYKNDILSLEMPTEAQLIDASQLLKNALKGNCSKLVFYHWHSDLFQHYSDETIQEILYSLFDTP